MRRATFPSLTPLTNYTVFTSSGPFDICGFYAIMIEAIGLGKAQFIRP